MSASAITFSPTAKPTYNSSDNGGQSSSSYTKTSVNIGACITPDSKDLVAGNILFSVRGYESSNNTPYDLVDSGEDSMRYYFTPTSTSQECKTFKAPIVTQGINYYGLQASSYTPSTGMDFKYTSGVSGTLQINYAGTELPVYRFWSDRKQKHFYTNSHSEKTYVESNYYDYNYGPTWYYERVAFAATVYNGTSCSDGIPVYRFWSDQKQGHFYTASWNERQSVIANYPNIWKLESTAYCAGSTQTAKYSVPLYRFWSDQKQSHFYTADWNERQDVIARYPDI